MSVTRVEFTVAGEAAPKGSRIPGRRKNGSIYTRPASKREKPWADAVQAAAERTGVRLEPPYVVWLYFGMPRPAKPKYAWPSRSDVDKNVRLVLDALVTAGVLQDDRHVVELHASKAFADIPGTRIVVETTNVEGVALDQRVA